MKTTSSRAVAGALGVCVVAMGLAACAASPGGRSPASADPHAGVTTMNAIPRRAATYRCGAMEMAVRYDGGSRRASLAMPGKPPIVLPQQPAAVGVRFADGAGNEFWDRGSEAQLTVGGQRYAGCAAVPR